MKPTTRLLLFTLALMALALACDLSPAPTEPTLDENAVATSVQATSNAQMTANAPAATDTVPAPTETPDPNTIFAPNPLPAQYTGLIWEYSTCYDFDTFQPVYAADPSADACLAQNPLMTPQNGALMSGQAPLNPPSKGYCINPNLLPDPIAVQTDLYLCLQTNQGVYGFFVAREYQNDLNRIVFDLYLFP